MDRTCEERPAEDGSDEEDPDSMEAPTRIRDTPEDIVLEAPASGLAFHPARDLLAAGDVDGDVFVFSYSCQEGETKELWSSGHHLKACRAVAFSEDGQSEYWGRQPAMWWKGTVSSTMTWAPFPQSSLLSPRTKPSMF
ncbi:WDR55 isoform 4 [Pongo abelii]|uniref:WDR55 isoform 4 n=1 Tax=Pongo abelii TaxID=9601 RepID=A0A2J8VP94_PONAB|nr:WDR55 isoform 4 [Pongo abelii]